MTEEKKNELLLRVKPWIGTKFVPSLKGEAVCGGYADCISFPLAIFRGLGLVPKTVKIPNYNSKKCGQNAFNTICETLIDCDADVVWSAADGSSEDFEPEIGDLYLYSSGSAMHHLAIAVGDGNMIDCYPPQGVAIRPIGGKKLAKRLKYVFRFDC